MIPVLPSMVLHAMMADQIAHPEWNKNQQIQLVPELFHFARYEVGERIPHDDGDGGDDERIHQCLEKNRDIDGIV